MEEFVSEMTHDFEIKISDKLTEERSILQREFLETPIYSNNKVTEERILELASSGEIWVAKNQLIEQMRFGASEHLHELMALVESYDNHGTDEKTWCRILLKKYPKNITGNRLLSLRRAFGKLDWGDISKFSEEVLERDAKNWLALWGKARFLAKNGHWHKSAENLDLIAGGGNFNRDQEIESARIFYNAKKFQKVIRIYQKSKVISEDVKFLEILARAYYNLRMDRESASIASKLLRIDENNKIGLRISSRSLVRLGRLQDSTVIMEKFCEIYPKLADGWESLIETYLMMDNMEEAEEVWKKLRNNCGEDSEYFFTAIDVALRFHRGELYESMIGQEGAKYFSEPEFVNNLAQSHLKNGNLGGAWRVLSSNGIKPLESELREEIDEILEITKSTAEEIESGSKVGEIWTAQLATREILRSSGPRRQGKKKKGECHLISSSLDRGGAERQVAMTLKHLERDGRFDCFLGVHRLDNKGVSDTYLDELSENKSKIIDLSKIEIDMVNFSAGSEVRVDLDILRLFDTSVRRKICQLISHFEKYNPDLVHAWQDETIMTASLAGSITGVPVIIGSARSLRPDQKTELHIRKRPYLKNCFKEIFRYDENLLSTNSKAGKKSYSEWIGLNEDDVIVNENGVDFDEIENNICLPAIQKQMEEFDFSEENIIVGGLFRLEPGKRPELWIESFKIAMNQEPKLRGILVGGGRMEKTVREWVKQSGLDGKVMIVGETKDIGGWLDAMDIFLFTSITEGLPNVIIEAQGFGLPVVSTDVGGVSEIVTHGKTGLLIESDSSDLLGGAILELLGNADLSRMGELARLDAREKFSINRMVQKTCEIYSQVLAPS